MYQFDVGVASVGFTQTEFSVEVCMYLGDFSVWGRAEDSGCYL